MIFERLAKQPPNMACLTTTLLGLRNAAAVCESLGIDSEPLSVIPSQRRVSLVPSQVVYQVTDVSHKQSLVHARISVAGISTRLVVASLHEHTIACHVCLHALYQLNSLVSKAV